MGKASMEFVSWSSRLTLFDNLASKGRKETSIALSLDRTSCPNVRPKRVTTRLQKALEAKWESKAPFHQQLHQLTLYYAAGKQHSYIA